MQHTTYSIQMPTFVYPFVSLHSVICVYVLALQNAQNNHTGRIRTKTLCHRLVVSILFTTFGKINTDVPNCLPINYIVKDIDSLNIVLKNALFQQEVDMMSVMFDYQCAKTKTRSLLHCISRFHRRPID